MHLGIGHDDGGKWTVFKTTVGGKMDSVWEWIEYARRQIGRSQE